MKAKKTVCAVCRKTFWRFWPRKYFVCELCEADEEKRRSLLHAIANRERQGEPCR